MGSKLKTNSGRRSFIARSGLGLMGAMVQPFDMGNVFFEFDTGNKIPLFAHLWVYASKYPPNWDCTPDLENVFSDLSYAGIEGLELMEVILRPQGAVKTLLHYIDKYQVPVSGSSYGVGFGMWDKDQHDAILSDLALVLPNLEKVGGKTLGVSVGNAPEQKTEKQLDHQAELLKEIIKRCEDHGIVLNFHNHTYEVENNLHDLKGTLDRIPDLKLGPDLNWLIRAGVDPVEFIHTYGKQIVYLHIRDEYKNGEWTEYVGQGDTDFKSIAKALKSVEFKGAAAIELAFPNDFTPVNSLRDDWKMSAEYVRSTFEFGG